MIQLLLQLVRDATLGAHSIHTNAVVAKRSASYGEKVDRCPSAGLVPCHPGMGDCGIPKLEAQTAIVVAAQAVELRAEGPLSVLG